MLAQTQIQAPGLPHLVLRGPVEALCWVLEEEDRILVRVAKEVEQRADPFGFQILGLVNDHGIPRGPFPSSWPGEVVLQGLG